jgi:hypothetical protein
MSASKYVPSHRSATATPATHILRDDVLVYRFVAFSVGQRKARAEEDNGSPLRT